MASSLNLAEGLAASYILDPARSRFLVRAYAGGMLAGFGHNPTIAIRRFSGEARFLAQSPERSSLQFRIEAASLAVTGDVNEKDRREMEHAMNEEVLETARYPEITFESFHSQANQIAEGMYQMKIGGKLTLHGIARDIEIPSNVMVADDSLRAYGELAIRQTDYRIRLVSVAGGALKLKDELKLSFDIAARRKRDNENS